MWKLCFFAVAWLVHSAACSRESVSLENISSLESEFDKVAEDFLTSLSLAHSKTISRKKRELDTDLELLVTGGDVYRLQTIVPVSKLCNPAVYSTFLNIGNATYAVCATEATKYTPAEISVGVYREHKWYVHWRWYVGNPKDLAAFHLGGYIYIFVADRDKEDGIAQLRINIATLAKEEDYIVHGKYPRSISIWPMKVYNRYHMAIVNSPGHQHPSDLSSQIFIYEWIGTYFDKYAEFEAYDVKDIEPFHIHGAAYLAIANFRRGINDFEVDSEILKYNLDKRNWVTHQKIRTYGAMDWEFFSLGTDIGQEFFLAVANKEGGASNIQTVIYKFVKDRFVPFQCLPTPGAVSIGSWSSGSIFVLAIANVDAVYLYQYDGWQFVMSGIQYTQGSMSSGVTHLKFHNAVRENHEVVILSVSNPRQQNELSVFEIGFVKENSLDDWNKAGTRWCMNAMSNLAASSSDFPLLNDVIFIDQPHPITINGSLFFEGGFGTDKLKTPELKEVIGQETYNSEMLLKLQDQQKRLEAVNAKIGYFEEVLKNSLQIEGNQTIYGNLQFKDVSFNCEDKSCSFDSIEANMLNGEDISDWRRNLVFLDSEQIIDGSLFAENIIANNINVFGMIDSVESTTLVTKSGDHNITGTKTFVNFVTATALEVAGLVDGVKISPTNILLTSGHQSVTGDLTFRNIDTTWLKVESVNGIDLQRFYEDTVRSDTTSVITGKKTFQDIFVNDLTMNAGSTINGIDLVDLWENTLWTSGNQKIKAPMTFQTVNLQKDLFALLGINGLQIPGPRVVTLSGFANVTAPHVFKTSTTIAQLNVLNSLNGIQTLEVPGKLPQLDILLKTGNQVVTGKKSFNTIHLDANSYVTGTVNGVDLSELKTMVLHRDPSTQSKRTWTFNNLRIEGPLTVNKISDYDLDFLYTNALKLNDTDIPEIIFKDTVFIEELVSHNINGIDIERDLVLINKPQVITGRKVIQEVVLEENSIIVETLNNVNMTFLTETILRIGSQSLKSKVFNGNVKIDKLTVRGSINNVPVSEIVTLHGDRDLLYSRELINVTFREINAKNINVGGTVNGIYIDEMMRNTMTYEGHEEVIGKKIIKGTIRIDNGLDLTATNINGINILDLWEDAVFLDVPQEVKGPKTFKSSVNFKNLIFTTIDGVSGQDINYWMLKDVSQTVEGNVVFLDGISIKNLNIEGYINGINITELDSSIVKINEPSTIEGPIIFDSLVTSKGDIILSGLIQGVDLSEEAVTRSGDKTVTGVKTFTQDLTIMGDTTVNGSVDGILVQKLCQNALLVDQKQNISQLTIRGDVTFLGGGTVGGKVSGIDLVKLHEIAVSLDDELTFYGQKTFENLSIEGPVILEGTLGGVDIKELDQTYMSLTKDQVITAEIKFSELIFEGTVSAKRFNTAFQMINDVNVSTLTRVLRTDTSQSKITEHFFDKITFHGNVNVSGQVNGLNIPEEVMRHNHTNIVDIPKVFEKPLRVGNLVIGENNLMQGVNVTKWFETAVLKDGGSCMIDGYKTFHNLTVVNAWVGGLLDGLKVSEENLFMTYGDQVLTGKKIFKSRVDISGSLTVNGLVDGIDLDYLSTATLQRGKNNTISGTKYFSKPLTMQHLDAPTVAGVNLEGLERKINTRLDFERLQSRLQEISGAVDKMNDAINKQATVLQYYELFQEFDIPSAYSWLYLFGEDCGELLLLSENSSSQTYCSSIRLFEFYPEQQQFVAHPQEIVTSYAVSVKKLSAWEATYLFVANQNPIPSCSSGQTIGAGNTTGDIYSWNAGSFETYQRLEILPAIDMVVFQDEKLCCVVYIHLHLCTVYCSEGNDQLFELLEILPTSGGRKASVLRTGEGIILAIVAENLSTRDIYVEGEKSVDVYFWNSEESTFASPGQTITSTYAQSVLLMSHATKYSSFVFLVIAEGKIPTVQNEPRLVIYRYDDFHGLFQKYQAIKDYGELEWLVLQTGELILFVLDSQMGKLKLYEHKGASGFVNVDTINSLGSVNVHAFIREVDINDLNHYVALAGPRVQMAYPSQGVDYAKLLKSKMKGNRHFINY